MNSDAALESSSQAASAWWVGWRGAVSRALAIFLGGFSILNICGGIKSAHFDANLWWIDFRAFEPWLTTSVLCAASTFLLWYGLAPNMKKWRLVVTLVLTTLLLLESGANAVTFYYLLSKDAISAALPIPFSIFVALAIAFLMANFLRPSVRRPKWQPIVLATFAIAIVFPLLQMFCFGKTDYRRKADIAVVFGARVYASGKPSDALADRVRTGVELYRQGLVPKLLFSGGPGDGAIHETEAMRAMAIRLGVPDRDILIDSKGINTRATVKNTEQMFPELAATRVLVVSHFYHLPRIKMSYQRTGWNVYTVPARESYTLKQMPFFMAREVAALWVYYLRPLAERTRIEQGIG